jgi:hypothetical protein
VNSRRTPNVFLLFYFFEWSVVVNYQFYAVILLSLLAIILWVHIPDNYEQKSEACFHEKPLAIEILST